MSCVVNANLEVTDLASVQAAVTVLGMSFREGQKTYRAHEGELDCEHAIAVPGGQYEIGLLRDGEKFSLMYDRWGQHGAAIERLAGPGLGRLRQEYAVAVTERRVEERLARAGFRSTRENLANGTVRLTLRRR